MGLLPSIGEYIYSEETDFRSPVSESTIQKVGSTCNYILDYSTMIPGLMLPYGGLESNLVLTAWLPCDGRAVSRVTYSNLFAAIGELHGSGDGVSTFNVPDMRGMFPRMQDATSIGAAGRDPDASGRTPTGTGTPQLTGSIQGHAFASHSHPMFTNGGGGGAGWQGVSDAVVGINTGLAGGSETRPINYYVLMVIKT